VLPVPPQTAGATRTCSEGKRRAPNGKCLTIRDPFFDSWAGVIYGVDGNEEVKYDEFADRDTGAGQGRGGARMRSVNLAAANTAAAKAGGKYLSPVPLPPYQRDLCYSR
jgi:hypothetical protein